MPFCCRSLWMRGDIAVGVGADRFIHHDLEDEVGAAFQVETEIDALSSDCLSAVPDSP